MGSMPTAQPVDYNDSSEDMMKVVEGADSRLARQYEITMMQIP